MKTEQIELKRDAETRSDKILRLAIAYKNWVGAFVVLFAIGILMRWIVIPLGIPSWAAIIAILSAICAAPSYLTAKWLADKFYEPDVDFMVELDGASKHAVRVYKQLKGEFLKQYEKKQQEQTWTNELSKNVYMFRDIDHDEKVATGNYPTETPDVELLRDRERIDAQRWENNKWVRVGWKLFARFEAIEDNVKGRYFKSLVREGIERKAHNPDELLAEIENDIEELKEKSEEGDREKLQDIINNADPGIEMKDIDIDQLQGDKER
ncbi:hypothetical protein [Halococcus sediminicola]|uniref:hypothetical protein n=1 Tax=Halococcus sediminicola TaxID=1264579 RepID=UPI0012AB5379|nr:hypothetical protein [Halococcus sediminicola]